MKPSKDISLILKDSKKIYDNSQLSDEEINGLIKKYQNGDKQATEVLFAHLYLLFAKMTYSFYNCGESYDDIFIECVEHALNGLKKYDTTRQSNLSTYLYTVIKNGLLRSKRDNDKISINETFSLDFAYPDKDGELIDMGSFIPDESIDADQFRIVNMNMEFEEVQNIVNTFSERDKYIYCSLYGLFKYPRKKQIEIADKLGVCRQYISQRKQVLDKKVRSILSRKGVI